jgi:hypothetical protein
MLNKTELLKVINRLYFYLGIKKIKGVSFFRMNFKKFVSKISRVEKRKAFLFSTLLIKFRVKSLLKVFLENFLLLFLLYNNKAGILARLYDFSILRLLYVWNIFNFYLIKIKDIPNIQQLRKFLHNKLIMKKNIFSLKFVFFSLLKNKLTKNKFEFFWSLNSFLTNKNKFINCLIVLNNLLNNKLFKTTYLRYILKGLKKSLILNFNTLSLLLYKKKKRYIFLPFFIWIYKIFDNISLNYWLIFLIFWLRSFTFFYLTILTYIAPHYKNLIRTSIYASRYFLNFSRNIIIEKKLSFNIYNKIINNFYILRSFSSLLNYNYFQKLKFQHLNEIPFFKDSFSHWHLNINKFSKFINMHYNEYLYNHINKYYFQKENKNLNLQLLDWNENKIKHDSDLFFNFEPYKKEKNIKNIIFSKIKNNNKIKLYNNLKTKVPYLNKNLVFPSYVYISSDEHIEMNKDRSVEFKIEQRVRETKKKRMTRKLKDLSFINDLKLIINSEKLWKLLDERRKERKAMQKKKKYWKMKKKIKFFGYEISKRRSLKKYEKESKKDSFLSDKLNQSYVLNSTVKQSINLNNVPFIINFSDPILKETAKKENFPKKNKKKLLLKQNISLKYLKKLLKDKEKVVSNKELKANDNLNKKQSDKPLTSGQILANYVEKFTKIKFEMLDERRRRRNEKNNIFDKFSKNKFNKFNKFIKYEKKNKYGKYFKNKRFNKFHKFNRLRRYNFFNNNKFKFFIKRTEITKDSKLFKFIKYVIFSMTNKINKNNFIDRLNLFRELDDKFKLTKYGKTDRFNSFYKLILLHRYINRYDRLKRYSKVLKKAKFRRKYENTLNLRFCYAWNSVLKQYSKKFILPTKFSTTRPFWSFKLFDSIHLDSFSLKKSEGMSLNSKVSFVKNDHFLQNLLYSFVKNDHLNSNYKFFLQNSSGWYIMENYKSFYSFFSTKLEKMTSSMQLTIFKNFVLTSFFNFFWKSFFYFNLNIFFKNISAPLISRVYFFWLLNFFRKNKFNFFNFILLNLNVRLLKNSKIKDIKFFNESIKTKNKTFISEIKHFISEINVLLKEILYFKKNIFNRSKKNKLIIFNILRFFYLKFFTVLEVLKLNKKNLSSLFLFNFFKSELKKWKKKYIFFKSMFFSFLLIKKKSLSTNKQKKYRISYLFKKLNKNRPIRRLYISSRIKKINNFHFFESKLKMRHMHGLLLLSKFFKERVFFSILKLISRAEELNLKSDIDLERLIFIGLLLKNNNKLFINQKCSDKEIKKNINIFLNNNKSFKFSLKKGKRFLKNPESFKYVLKFLKNYKSFFVKDLLLWKHIKNVRFPRKKLVFIRLLYKLKKLLFSIQLLRYFILVCISNINIYYTSDESRLLLKNVIFFWKHINLLNYGKRVSVKIWYFFFGFFHFIYSNKMKKAKKSFKFLFRWCFSFFLPGFRVIEGNQIRLNSKKFRVFAIKRVANLIKWLLLKAVRPFKSQNKVKLKKNIFNFSLERSHYCYYKKMFRWRYNITSNSYKFFGLRFFNSKKGSTIGNIELKKRLLWRKKINHRLVMGEQKLNLKIKGRFNFFLPFCYFSKFFSSNVFLRSLKGRSFMAKDNKFWLPNYLNFFFNKNYYVNFWRNKKLLTLKQRPFFFKVNNFLSKVLVSKNLQKVYKASRQNLKKKFFFYALALQKIKGNKNIVFWFDYLRRQEFNFPRKNLAIDKYKEEVKNSGYRPLFSPKFFKGHFLNFSSKRFFAPLQLNAFNSWIKNLLLENEKGFLQKKICI